MPGHNAHILPRFRSWITNFSVKRKLLIIMLIQSVIFALVTLYLLYNSITNTINLYKNSNSHCMAKYTLTVNNSLEQMKEISIFPVKPLATGQYQEVYLYLKDGASFVGNYNFSNAFLENANFYLDIAQGIDMIAMYDSGKNGLYCWHGKSVYSGSYCALNESSSDWYSKTVAKRGAAVIVPISQFTGSGIPNADGNMLCITRSITHIGEYKSIGVLVLGILKTTLNHEFDTLRASVNEDFVLQYDGLSIAGNESLLGFKQQTLIDNFNQHNKNTVYAIIDSVPYMVNYYRFDDHLSIITKTPLSDILRGVSINTFPLIFFLFLVLLLMFLFTFYSTSSINHSIGCLITACANLENREFKINSFPANEMTGEFATLFSAFNSMTSRINHLVNEILQRDLEKKSIELYALRGQINSHYLYNTLELIRMKAYMQKSYDLAEMAMLLGSNLQYNLKEIDEQVTISQEIDSIYNYIKLIQFNYSDGIGFTVNIDREIMQDKIMKLILQPVIENTIAHAFGSAPQTLHIDIMGYSMGDDLILTVADDGIGMSPERLSEVQKALLGKQSKSKRVGLININRRIKLFYGEDYGIEINSAEQIGTTTSIRIPRTKCQKG